MEAIKKVIATSSLLLVFLLLTLSLFTNTTSNVLADDDKSLTPTATPTPVRDADDPASVM